MASSFLNKETHRYNLRKRHINTVMGPQTGVGVEEGADVIEMVERPPAEGKDEDDDWVGSELNEESDVMLRPEPDGMDDHESPIRTGKMEGLEEEEGFWLIAFQVFFPFLIAGLGMVGAGLVLDIVQVSC